MSLLLGRAWASQTRFDEWVSDVKTKSLFSVLVRVRRDLSSCEIGDEDHGALAACIDSFGRGNIEQLWVREHNTGGLSFRHRALLWLASAHVFRLLCTSPEDESERGATRATSVSRGTGSVTLSISPSWVWELFPLSEDLSHCTPYNLLFSDLCISGKHSPSTPKSVKNLCGFCRAGKTLQRVRRL